MTYVFQFGVLAQYRDQLLAGLWLTIEISVLSIVAGTACGILLASARSMGGRAPRAVHRSQIEAGEALGFTPFQGYRHVVLLPAIQKVYPSLCSQFVLMMLASSICSAISTTELTAAAAFVQSQSYRSFEVYLAVTGIYLILALALRGLLALLGLWLFGRRAARRVLVPVVEASA